MTSEQARINYIKAKEIFKISDTNEMWINFKGCDYTYHCYWNNGPSFIDGIACHPCLVKCNPCYPSEHMIGPVNL